MPTFPGRVCRQLGLPQTSYEITLLWTPILVRTADEDVYLREMAPWIEEWSRAAGVIGEQEEEGISLSQYEDTYKDILRDIATLVDHAIEERDLIAKDFEHLLQNFDGVVVERDSMRDELESVRVELERVRSVPSSSFVAPTLPGPSLNRIRDLERRVDRTPIAVGGNPSLADVNPYVRVPLPSSIRSQSQSRASTQLTRGLRGKQSFNRGRGGIIIKEVTFVSLFFFSFFFFIGDHYGP
ncbi:hypothetical protein AMTR_s00189p00031920 [Amborella trichopoda]|uniref:Uncharacterized protein n=1 Tax=Amborella trichopoda TaxID=13333 RepID=U5D7I5_AMBTC|nr:hypothetical protein AMTR_s00189p00031920 [Amborella trichopoda]